MAAPALSSETNLEPLQNPSIAEPSASNEIVDKYQVEETAAFIQDHAAHRIVALQFPDELLPDSVQIFKALKSRLDDSRELYILADTTFGSCCVDEIAAEHVNADVVVHYGYACLSPTARLPVYYVFTKRHINIDHCADTFTDHLQNDSAALADVEQILLRGDNAYEHKMLELREALSTRTKTPISYHPINRARIMTSPSSQPDKSAATSSSACCSSGDNSCTPQSNGCCGSGCKPPQLSSDKLLSQGSTQAQVDAERLPEKTAVLWIGPSTLALTHLLMSNPSVPVFAYEPDASGTGGIIAPQHSGTNKLLMRRYAAIQRARDADVLGIVVGTLGIASYLPLVGRIRSLLRAHEKKVYTLSVGKPTPAKLANYQEVECFVLVACPENSLLLTSPDVGKEFYRTMVTPWEMEVALGHGGASWDQGWRLGWTQAQEGIHTEGQNGDAEDGETSDPDVQYSAATGKLRTVRRYGKRPDAEELSQQVGDMALTKRPDSAFEVARLMGSAAGERLQGLTYQGLDPRYGLDTPAQLEQGRSGVARGYVNEEASR